MAHFRVLQSHGGSAEHVFGFPGVDFPEVDVPAKDSGAFFQLCRNLPHCHQLEEERS
jgi:hypothetical protein